MRCYHCGAQLSEHNFCTNCGEDVVLYKKILRTSNSFYNQGLERARVRDLSGAVASLRQSLRFHKNNIKARNLLGLVYFEMGEVPAALCEWVISKNLKRKNNLAAEYIDMLQSNSAKLDEINETIKKYNKALEYCQTPDGLDLAVIQLKSLLKTNPKFIRAQQLLALCYLVTKRPELARRVLERCRAIDVNNTTTLRYLAEAERMLNPADDARKKKKVQDNQPYSVVSGEGVDTIIQPLPPRERKGANTVLNILFGIAIGFAVAMVMVLPQKITQVKMEASDQIKDYSNQIEGKNISIRELEQRNSELDEKITTLTETLSAYAGTEGTLQSMENLLKAAALYLEKPESFLEVADYIQGVNEDNWTKDTSENYINLYTCLKTAIAPQTADSYYADGYNAYKSEQYGDAIAYFEHALFFVADHKDSMYYLGLSYEAAGKTEDARTTLNKVIELFPGTWHAKNAEKTLNKMGE